MIYQYRREDGTEFEYEQSMNDPRLTECPETGQPVKRIITGGHGPQLPMLKSVKYRDGNFVNSKLAKKLEANPFYTSNSYKRGLIEKQTEKAKNHNAELKRKVTGQISEL